MRKWQHFAVSDETAYTLIIWPLKTILALQHRSHFPAHSDSLISSPKIEPNMTKSFQVLQNF